ncbi:ATP-binding protein [Pseudonocardia kujensis]|uniref:ATP-binding protein n=1 Tax=Pseudonocardia kujensis TaxID=1128675 RepID=UPI001E5EC04B|nr:ATP-binding protein [Pseudonocardia kujensis]MCE0762818.1 ATP-binding protein [Pseudonocardia kujensis]
MTCPAQIPHQTRLPDADVTATEPFEPTSDPAAVLAEVTGDGDRAEADLTGLADSVEYVHRSWPANPAQLSVIRRELLGWLAPLGLSTEQQDDVVLAVDEAVANAVRHAYPEGRPGDVELTLWTEGEALCIEITDHGSWRPAQGEGGTVTSDERGGRGMLLMQHMVETVLVHFDGRGSRVLLRHNFGRPAEEGVGEHGVGEHGVGGAEPIVSGPRHAG